MWRYRRTTTEMSQEPSLDICWKAAGQDFLFSELDNIIESLHEDALSPDQKVEDHGELSPALSPGGDMFLWEDVKLSDTEQLFANLQNGKFLESQDVTCEVPTPVTSVLCEVPTPVTSEDIDNATNKNSSSNALLNMYGLSDEQLGDISLKKLRSLCKTESDYDELKAYRRTCQNRYYARSSRTKQQVKTSSLAKKLDESEQEIARLQQENEMKDATIRCLQLELQILRSIKPETN